MSFVTKKEVTAYLKSAHHDDIRELVEKGILTWLELARKLTVNPSQILGIPKGVLKEDTYYPCVVAHCGSADRLCRDGCSSLHFPNLYSLRLFARSFSMDFG